VEKRPIIPTPISVVFTLSLKLLNSISCKSTTIDLFIPRVLDKAARPSQHVLIFKKCIPPTTRLSAMSNAPRETRKVQVFTPSFEYFVLTFLALHKTIRRESEASLQPATFTYHQLGSRDASPSLAISASNMAAVATAAARYIPPMVDPQLFRDEVHENHPESMTPKFDQDSHDAASPNASFFNNSVENSSNWVIMDGIPAGNLYHPETNHSEHAFDSPEASAHAHIAQPLQMQQPMNMIAEYGNGQKASKPKVRGRFETGRRKEVQKVRRLGACLRCRMLKKPCGEGTPCATCINVASARVWNFPCTRIHTGERVEMFTSGLHAALSLDAHLDPQTKVRFRSSPHLIDVSHFPDTNYFASFHAIQGQESLSTGSNIDPGLNGDLGSKTRRLFDDDLELELTKYAKNILPIFVRQEPSHFMNVTLETAIQRSGEVPALAACLELWLWVHFLVDSSTSWVMSERTSEQLPAGVGNLIAKDADPTSYEDLRGQLNAATEKKVTKLFRDVLSDFEKRLLTRAKTSRFDFFLIALIVLNCIEKCMWLYRSWEQDEFKDRYTLSKATEEYLMHGEELAQTIQLLLQARNLAPRTFVRPDGYLSSDTDQDFLDWYTRVQLTCKCLKMVMLS
jgi:hypothetical protein